MALPVMTPEQRAENLAKAQLANAERARVKAALKEGSTTLADVLDIAAENEPLAKMKVSAMLQALPGVGAVRARKLMEQLGIPETRRVRGLGPNQRAELLKEFASAGA